MWEWLERVFRGASMPHGHCYLWSPWMVWTQVHEHRAGDEPDVKILRDGTVMTARVTLITIGASPERPG